MVQCFGVIMSLIYFIIDYMRLNRRVKRKLVLKENDIGLYVKISNLFKLFTY
jgi:hypothetical protein